MIYQAITDAGVLGALLLSAAVLLYGLTKGRNPNFDAGRAAFRFAAFCGILAAGSAAVWALGGPTVVIARIFP